MFQLVLGLFDGNELFDEAGTSGCANGCKQQCRNDGSKEQKLMFLSCLMAKLLKSTIGASSCIVEGINPKLVSN